MLFITQTNMRYIDAIYIYHICFQDNIPGTPNIKHSIGFTGFVSTNTCLMEWDFGLPAMSSIISQPKTNNVSDNVYGNHS